MTSLLSNGEAAAEDFQQQQQQQQQQRCQIAGLWFVRLICVCIND
jgi:hypothetical protein